MDIGPEQSPYVLEPTVDPVQDPLLHLLADKLQQYARRPRDGGSWNDRRFVRKHLTPAFGQIPIDRANELDQIHYQPTNENTGAPFHARTVARHRNILEQAIQLAATQWTIQT